MLGHLLRPGGAVEAENRHVQRAHDRGGGHDVGADQHGPGRLDGHLDHERHLAATFRAGPAGAVDGGLDLERVLAGLDQERVDAAGQKPARLDRDRVLDRPVGDVAEAGQARAGADRAHDETVTAVARQARDRLEGELDRAAVDLEGAILEAELGERDRAAAERVGLDRVRAGEQIVAVDVADQIRPRQAQDLRAVLLAPEVVERQALGLDLAAHAAVEEHDAVACVVEKIGHRGDRRSG